MRTASGCAGKYYFATTDGVYDTQIKYMGMFAMLPLFLQAPNTWSTCLSARTSQYPIRGSGNSNLCLPTAVWTTTGRPRHCMSELEHSAEMTLQRPPDALLRSTGAGDSVSVRYAVAIEWQSADGRLVSLHCRPAHRQLVHQCHVDQHHGTGRESVSDSCFTLTKCRYRFQLESTTAGVLHDACVQVSADVIVAVVDAAFMFFHLLPHSINRNTLKHGDTAHQPM